MGQYIPDITERFPEGYDGVDMTPMYFGEPVDWCRALKSEAYEEFKKDMLQYQHFTEDELQEMWRAEMLAEYDL